MRLLALVLCFLLPLCANAQRVPETQAEIQLSFAPLVKQAAPAVVNIFAERVVQRRVSPFMGNPMFEDLFREFGQSRTRVQNSLGSGVILSDDGIVVSNYHVVGMATEIRVVLKDRREYSARVLLANQETDLAILKIEADEPLPFLEFRDSDQVEVGELVLAIGNPFGVGQTVSSGIISGLARSGVATGNARGYFLQTDAPINPGNSGGALIDMTGRLVGVNTSILTRSGGSNGIGFAIPANLVARYVEQAAAGFDEFEQPWAGVFGQAVDSDIAEGFGMDFPEGVVLTSLHQFSPFTDAGLLAGDIVLEMDGLSVNAPAEMLFRMSVGRIGDFTRVMYQRDGVRNEADVLLMTAPNLPDPDERVVAAGSVLEGLAVANVNPRIGASLNLPMDAAGVVVTQVPNRLRSIGLRPGDLIRAINGELIESTADIERMANDERRNWRIDGVSRGRTFSYRFRI